MTILDFETIVREKCSEFGAQTSLNLRMIVGLKLREWSRWTRWKVSTDIDWLIPISTPAPYAYNGAFYTVNTVPVELIEPVSIWLGDILLQRTGAVNAAEFTRRDYVGSLASESLPQYWYPASNTSWNTIGRLAFASAHSGTMIAVIYPSAITAATANDVALDLPDDMLLDFATFVAAEVLRPLAKGDQLSAVREMDAMWAAAIERWRREFESPDVAAQDVRVRVTTF